MTTLIQPHGGQLINGLIPSEEISIYQQKLPHLTSWSLNLRQLCDVEMIINGGFSPLTGFLNQIDYESVLSEMRLANGTLWPMPIVLDMPQNFVEKIELGQMIALRDSQGVVIALLEIQSIWQPNKQQEALAVFATDDLTHPGVNYLFQHTHDYYIGGRVLGMRLPIYYDFLQHRRTPAQVREYFKIMGWEKIVAFQTRNPLHRAHAEMIKLAASSLNAHLLLHPSVGQTKPGDFDHYTRVRCYEKLLPHLRSVGTSAKTASFAHPTADNGFERETNPPHSSILLSLLPLAMRMAGPREALWHAIIRKNYGCTHFIVGRDHAGPGKNKAGENFYDPYAAQTLTQSHQQELEIGIVPFQEIVYVENKRCYLPMDKVTSEDKVLSISGTEFNYRLRNNLEIPEWFSYAEVIAELQKSYPARKKQGFTLFFTGLSGAGKSTIAHALMIKLLELTGRPVTLLDGDEFRKLMSSELGFSKEHRDLNIRRIGFIAANITQHRGIAICAPIAPYQMIRDEVRGMVEAHGGFIEVHISTPLETCEARDPKGLYAKARKGLLPNFTGIDDPYEKPINPELVIDASECSVVDAVRKVIDRLQEDGWLNMPHPLGRHCEERTICVK